MLIHDLVGVKRDWRGRGIAGALKRAEIAWAKREGYTRLETENELRNEPIRRLNLRLGYVEEPGVVVYRRAARRSRLICRRMPEDPQRGSSGANP